MALNNILSSTVNALTHFSLNAQRTAMDDCVEAVCNPNFFEPDLAAELEICDTINSKGGSTPRDAALAIVRLINHRNDLIGTHALELLDVCVKNCGYPFHLHVSSKEFLNELVRRFPSKPPVILPRNQRRILELINHWHVTFIVNGKHQHDLRHIDDMYRLLSSKGYRFPGVTPTQVAVLSEKNDVLKSADEMEFEDSVVKKAKLQELLRRATPADLDEANKIMKELVGFENEVDYKAKERDELDRLAQNARSLHLFLDKIGNASELSRNTDAHAQFTQCKSAQKKVIQLIGLRENGDSLSQIIELNDLLNSVIQRYLSIESASLDLNAPGPTSLISLSPTTSPQITPSNQMPPHSTVNDLSGFSIEKPLKAQVTPSSPLTNIDAILLDHLPGHHINDLSLSASNTAIAPNYILHPHIQPHVTASLSKKTVYNHHGLKVDIQTETINNGHVKVECQFSNSNTYPISSLNWQLAAFKNVNLQIDNLSSRILPPMSVNASINRFSAQFDSNLLQLSHVKIKFRVGYTCLTSIIEQEGAFSLI